MKRHLASILFTCFCFTYNLTLAQNNQVFNDIVGKITTYKELKNPEKTYITTDKDFYINGETIWYKVFLLNGSNHTATDKSNVVYIELINDKDSIVAQQKLINQGFGVHGSMDIAEPLEKGHYILRAYTKYMLNEKQPILHHKKITVQAPRPDSSTLNLAEKNTPQINQSNSNLERLNVSFFPEGGSLISGISSILGIKITDNEGTGIALKGKIFDDTNNLISVFKSHEFGLGKAVFTPKFNKKYFAQIVVNDKTERYPLPNASQTGYALRIRNLGKSIELDVATNLIEGLKETMLVGHIRGRTFFKHIEKTSDSIFSVKLLTKELEDGVAHFTLFTRNGEPVCERLIFIENTENVVVLTAKLDSTVYDQREKVSIKLDLKNKKGFPLKGNLTTSIIVNTNSSNNSGSEIKSWLLLNSDVGGTVPNANYFFEKNNSKRKYLLDALMLTHGWRRFVWKDLLNKKVNKTLEFEPEKGIMIEGKTTSFKNEYMSKQSLVNLSFLGESLFQEEKVTNAQGVFSFGPFNFNDTINILLQAKPLKKIDKNEFSIYTEDSFPKPLLDNKRISEYPTKKINFPEKYLKQAYKSKVEKFRYDPKIIALESVSVEAKKKKTHKELVNEEIQEFTRYRAPDSRIFTDSLYAGPALSALDLLLFVPGVQVTGYYPNQKLVIPRAIASSFTGSTGPLILLDGIPVDISFIANMRANEIMFVDLLVEASTTLYGLRGASGVIAFYSNKQLRVNLYAEQEYPNILNFKIGGFAKVREFYSPNYAVPSPKHIRADYRTTLHWEPNITITDSDSASIDFFTGDLSGTYSVKVEGITMDGRPVSAIETFMVN
ncbi:hypothetical protein [uncultured Croceitalea sp.]|uniref:hypothetical protein n=1 Tax=uncultured Croceitalea sp. TaxID=1798908 RepID=UPI00374FD9C3